ncbi:hypothetical protein JOF53_004893 [Crossiella equi]|uniref:Uncharacterized protein n=1 Tax=Crossiella equi TaxID=130796 RepID=A0ABS5AHH7_9PSEU|nr:hypothetical protein [Crossiella equi]MBP2476021.1 hypothetical protein [Crossiella equi]
MADYRVEYETLAAKTLELLSAPRRQQIMGEISAWARNSPESGNHARHRIPLTVGFAEARVEHRSASVYVLTVFAISC